MTSSYNEIMKNMVNKLKNVPKRHQEAMRGAYEALRGAYEALRGSLRGVPRGCLASSLQHAVKRERGSYEVPLVASLVATSLRGSYEASTSHLRGLYELEIFRRS